MASYLTLLVTRTPTEGVKLSYFGKPVTVPPELSAEVAALTLDYVVGRCNPGADAHQLLGLDMMRTRRNCPPGLATRLRAHIERGEFALADAAATENRAEVEKSAELLFYSTRAKASTQKAAAALEDFAAGLALDNGATLHSVQAFEALYRDGDPGAAAQLLFKWLEANGEAKPGHQVSKALDFIPAADWPVALLRSRARLPATAPAKRVELLKLAASKGADVSAELAAAEQAGKPAAPPPPKKPRGPVRRLLPDGKALIIIAFAKDEPDVYWTPATDELLKRVRKSRELPDELVTFESSSASCVTLPLEDGTPIAAFSSAAGDPPLQRLTVDELFEITGVDHLDRFY